MTSGLAVWEWWPDHGCPTPLWTEDGRALTPAELTDVLVPGDLLTRIVAWNAEYAETKIPGTEGLGDRACLESGRYLLAETRAVLAGRTDIVTTEPWWS